MSRLIKIYTDGSSIGNPGPGGYGIVMLIDKEDYKKEFSQGFKLTTNNRMELLAVIVALEKIKIKNFGERVNLGSIGRLLIVFRGNGKKQIQQLQKGKFLG